MGAMFGTSLTPAQVMEQHMSTIDALVRETRRDFNRETKEQFKMQAEL